MASGRLLGWNFAAPLIEPDVLLHGCDVSHFPAPTFKFEDRNEYLRLAKVWGELGVLSLSPQPLSKDHFCRVFNVFKDVDRDRQIGDRRIPNARERHVPGPSQLISTPRTSASWFFSSKRSEDLGKSN